MRLINIRLMVETILATTNYPDLGAGAHTVAVRDDNGCVYSTTINITSSGGPTDIDVTTTPAACGADNGSIRITDVTGGNGPYEYSIDGGNYTCYNKLSDLGRRRTHCCSKR